MAVQGFLVGIRLGGESRSSPIYVVMRLWRDEDLIEAVEMRVQGKEHTGENGGRQMDRIALQLGRCKHNNLGWGAKEQLVP